MSSNHPELVALRECLEAHRDNENLVYLTDSEDTLQSINEWVGGGAKLRLTRSPDGDVRMIDIIIKLQKKVKTGEATLLIKVKTHRGDPLNEETDIRSEIGRLEEDNERTWSTQTDRTIYQWSEPSKTKKGILITKTSVWTQTVRNRMRQKTGEIQAFRVFERGSEK